MDILLTWLWCIMYFVNSFFMARIYRVGHWGSRNADYMCAQIKRICVFCALFFYVDIHTWNASRKVDDNKMFHTRFFRSCSIADVDGLCRRKTKNQMRIAMILHKIAGCLAICSDDKIYWRDLTAEMCGNASHNMCIHTRRCVCTYICNNNY